ncbi:MAG: murein biosynthesis integral membrane protein MurJ, partial [Pseudanabaenaceae cyanobacterium]
MPESPEVKPKRSLAKIAGIVAAATLLSKVFGLLRQVAIAAAFGVGPAYGAYNFAYVIPGFLLILLGGINGPFHSAIVSVLSKRPPKESAMVIETITTLVVGILLVVTVLLVIFAQPMLYLTAPGLFASLPEVLANGGTAASFAILEQTKQIAITQFQIMAPLAMLAGLIGIGFGTLNATDQYWLPSVSPLFSSVTVLMGVGGLMLWFGDKITAPENALVGGAVLAWATLAGAVLQWLIQLPAQWKSGMGGLRLRFNFGQPAVREIMKIMGPATFSSGMLQINVWTDLFFASFIPNASAAVSAMGYAGLLIQTPLGILSNVILVPL